MTRTRLLMVDPELVSDLAAVDESVLKLTTTYVGEVHVPMSPFALPGIRGAHAENPPGCLVFEPSLEQLWAASNDRRHKGLSLRERLCIAIASSPIGRWTCVSDEKPIHAACVEDGLSAMTVFDLLAALFTTGVLSQAAAAAIASELGRTNRRLARASKVFLGKIKRFT